MKFSHFLNAASSDDLLLKSAADFFDSKVTQTIEVIDKISEIIEHAGEVDYQFPSLQENDFIYDINNVSIVVPGQDLEQALINELEEFEATYQNVVYSINVDSLINQYSDSIRTNKIVVESLRTLMVSGTEVGSNMMSEFQSRLAIKVGELSDSAQLVASQLAETIITAGTSVGERVRAVLRFIGAYAVDEQTADELIGPPDCELKDISGTNAFQSWFSTFPDRFSKIGEWLKDTVHKLLELLKGIVSTVLGSSAYRTLKKFFTTLALQADSFAYNHGTENGDTIGNYGHTMKISNFIYNQSWMVDDGTPLSKLQSVVLSHLTTSIPPSNINDCCDLIGQYINDCNTNANYTDPFALTVYWELASRWHASMGPMDPAGYNDPPSWTQIQDQGSHYQWCKVAYVYGYIAASRYQLNPDNWNAPWETYSEDFLIECILGAILDKNHINDAQAVHDKLSSTNYLRLDLPASVLYMWLVGSEVYVTRRVSPKYQYANDNWTDIVSKVIYDVGYPAIGPGTAHHLRISASSFQGFMNWLRTSSDEYVDTDEQMAKAVYAAHIIDTIYLYMLDYYRDRSVSFDGEVLNIDTSWDMGDSDFWTDCEDYFMFLTGWTSSAFISNYVGATSTDLTNLTLAREVGGGMLHEWTNSSPYGRILRNITYGLSSDNYYVPYCHQTSIDSGRYHVVTDSELGDLMTTLLEVVAVIVSVVVVIKVTGKLKRKVLKLNTMAESNAWKLVTDGKYDDAAVNLQYKLEKKAKMLEKLQSALYGSVTKALSRVTSAVQSVTTSAVAKVRTLLSGSPTDENSIDLKDIQDLIKG